MSDGFQQMSNVQILVLTPAVPPEPVLLIDDIVDSR